jgi:hypothetical protein
LGAAAGSALAVAAIAAATAADIKSFARRSNPIIYPSLCISTGKFTVPLLMSG